MAGLGSALRALSTSVYEILDDDIAAGQVEIWSADVAPPRLGDTFLIESDGRSYDLEVVELVTFRGDWSARCRAERAAG